MSPLPDRIKAITDYPRPDTVEQLRRFLGMFNFYRSHLPHAISYQAELNKFLHNCKKKDKTQIKWSDSSIQAFEQCKLGLKNAVTLSHPSIDAPLALMTDASDTCVGAVLQQKIDGKWLPLGYFSKALSATQKKYCTYDKELTAIYMAMVHFRNMIEGRQVTVFTDHKPLTFAFSKLGTDKEIPRRARQLLYISEFTSDIQHVSGAENLVADALSRVESISCPTAIDYDELVKAQAQENEGQIISDSNPERNGKLVFKYVILPHSDKRVYCEVSTSSARPVLPVKFRKVAFHSIHDIAHPGVRSTRKMITQRFFWPGMNKDINQWSKACISCQRSKVSRHTQSNVSNFPVSARFEHIHTDIVGPLPTSRLRYRYCVTIIDRFTRWPEIVPVSDISADTISKVIYEQWICRFGCPSRITTDQGRQFESDLFNELMKLVGVQRIRTTPYHPQSNGMIERWHRSFKCALTSRLTGNSDWADELPTVMLGLRAACRTDSGFSAAELVYGQTLRLPGEFFQTSDQRISDQHIFLEQLRKCMSRLRPNPRAVSGSRKIFVSKDLSKCSHVFLRNDMLKKSLSPTYDGPFLVLSRDDKKFKIRLYNRDILVSIDRLKPAYLLDDENNTLDSDLLQKDNSSTYLNNSDCEKSLPPMLRTMRSGRQIKLPVRFAEST